MKYLFFILTLSTLFFSCTSNSEILSRLNGIKTIGNQNPELALNMLDSVDVSKESDYIQAKYNLLFIRLSDKADILPTSSKDIKSLVKYFNEHGNDADRQEAYYYEGSVQRDLQDYPSAIEAFLKSAEVASNMKGLCDSLLLRNTYSNLSYLSNMVQDNKRFLIYSKKEYEISNAINQILFPAIVHLADAYLYADSIDKATEYYNIIFDAIESKQTLDIDVLSSLLMQYSYIGDICKAERIKDILDAYCSKNRISPYHLDGKTLLAIGHYYESINKLDSSIYYNQTILKRGDNHLRMFDASRHLFRLFAKTNQKDEAIQSGLRFLEISDTLNLGLRQEMSATVNNLYKYNRDKEEEIQLIEENHRYHNTLEWIVFSIIIASLIITILIIHGRNKYLQKIVLLSNRIAFIEDEKTDLSNQLQDTHEQNKTFIRILAQSKLEKLDKDIIFTLRQSSDGKKTMTNNDWMNLYYVVDQEYPDFKEKLLQRIDVFTEKQMQICYLLRIGLSKQQIVNITGLSRPTIWRWDKKHDWISREALKAISTFEQNQSKA